MIRYRSVWLALLLLPASGVFAQATTTVPAPKPGEGFEVERYALALRPDLATGAVSGIETIVVRGTAGSLAAVSFSPNALRVHGATVDGVAVPVASDPSAVTFPLPHPLNPGEAVTLRFGFDGQPARGVTTVPGGLYTGYFACDWMVCLQDAPGDKAEFALDLFLPPGAVSVGVGKAEPTVAVGDGLVLHRWRSTRPEAPYLYGFAAGAFARASVASPAGELVYVDATGQGEAGGALARRFAQTLALAAFFADKAGLGLPDRRYAQVLVPGREAQEAAGFSLIGQEYLDREISDPSAAWVVAHELAHQWWGNLVTCATWRDFWLNEGMATFMVAAWKERALGPTAYREELDIARQRLARAREAGFDKPLAWGGKYPSLATRRAVQYSKGALFLARLRETLGEAAFWGGLKAYTRQHAGGTVTSRDFQAAMERESGQNLGPLFTEWVYGDEGAG